MDHIGRWPVGLGDLIETGNRPVEPTAGEQRRQTGDFDPIPDLAVDEDPPDHERRVLLRHRRQLHSSQFRRLMLGETHSGHMTDQRLDERGDGRHRECGREAEPVQSVAATFDHAARVHAGDDESDDHVRGDEHVQELQPDCVVEHRCERIDIDDSAADDPEARGRVHPRVDGDDAEAADNSGGDHRDQGHEMHLGRHPAPAEEIDADEDRLDEERDSLERERETDHVAVSRHHAWPQQTHLEAQHRARHCADGEQHRSRLRPPLGEDERIGIAAQATPVDQVDERREGHPEARQDDVEPERNRHLVSRCHQLAGIAKHCNLRSGCSRRHRMPGRYFGYTTSWRNT